MVGAADQALEMLAVTRHPGDRPEHERVVAALRTALGEERFAALHAQGAELSLSEAISLALSDDDPPVVPEQRTIGRRTDIAAAVRVGRAP